MSTIGSLAWIMALCSGLLAGTYLVFSGFAIRAFASMEPAAGIAAMNAINRTIVRSVFMPLFFGSTIIALIMIVCAFLFWGTPGCWHLLLAGAVFALGMFGVTAAANVPLNNELDRVAGADSTALTVWARYRTRWTAWNTLRTIACVVTLVICMDLLVLSGSVQ